MTKKKDNNHTFSFWFLIVFMVILDITSSAVIKLARNHQNKKLLVMGIFLFTLACYIYYRLLYFDGLAVVSAMWSILSLLGVTLISLLFFKETFTFIQKIGIFIGIISIICLT